MADRTLLLGLDGATFTILDPFMESGIMPCLAAFAARGTRAELISTIPHVTYTAWTSLVTGRSPGEHGIFDFVHGVETENGIFVKPVDSRDLRCETLWSLAGRQERRVISLNFPVMYPPKPLSGAMVPGFVSWRHLRHAVYPPELYDRLCRLPGFDAKALSWDMDMEQQAVQEMPESEYEDWIRFHINRAQQWYAVLWELMRDDDSDLIAYLDDGPDKLFHLAWPFIDSACFPANPTAREARIRGLCLDYFRQLDRFLGEALARLGEDTRLFIVSDHGFGPTTKIFYLNVWLQQRGYLQWDAATETDPAQSMFAGRKKTQIFDWKHTLAYALTPSSNGIHIRVSRQAGEPGVRPEAYEALRRELSAELLAFTDPETGESVVERVLTREEAFPGSANEHAPDLTLILRDQGFVSTRRAPTALEPRRQILGMHRMNGVFMAAGPGIRQGCQTPPLSILDVCPALLYSLGLEIPRDMTGRFPPEVFEPGFLEARPPRIGLSSRNEISPAIETEELSEEEEQSVLQRLANLGYIEF